MKLQQTISGWDLILGLSLSGILVASWYAFAAPAPKIRKSASTGGLNSITAEVKTLEGKIEEAKKREGSRTWHTSAEALGSNVLALLHNISDKNHVQLITFHGGRTIQASKMTEAQYLATFEGPFLDVMKAIKDIEDPKTKIAVSDLKITSSQTTDKITANISVTGFLLKEGI